MTYPLLHVPERSRYAECRAAARRARILLYHGAKPLSVSKSLKPERIAVEEVVAGVVPFKIIRPGGKPVLLAAPVPITVDSPVNLDQAA